jgi:hypothetical protein
MSALSTSHRDAAPLSLLHRLSLAAEILTAYAQVRKELRRGDLRQTVEALRRTDTIVTPEVGPRRLAQAATRTVRLLPFDSRCLMASLVVTKLLARRGVPAVFILGVSPGPGFAAHAWVECEGRPVLPAGDSSFGRLLEL